LIGNNGRVKIRDLYKVSKPTVEIADLIDASFGICRFEVFGNPNHAVGSDSRTSCATLLWSCNGVVCGDNAKVNAAAKHTLDCPLHVEALLGGSRLQQQV
jgi:hypothetical protein